MLIVPHDTDPRKDNIFKAFNIRDMVYQDETQVGEAFTENSKTVKTSTSSTSDSVSSVFILVNKFYNPVLQFIKKWKIDKYVKGVEKFWLGRKSSSAAWKDKEVEMKLHGGVFEDEIWSNGAGTSSYQLRRISTVHMYEHDDESQNKYPRKHWYLRRCEFTQHRNENTAEIVERLKSSSDDIHAWIACTSNLCSSKHHGGKRTPDEEAVVNDVVHQRYIKELLCLI